MQDKYIIGIDGGASKTTAILFDSAGNTIKYKSDLGSNLSVNEEIFSELKVWHGKKNTVKVYTKEDIYETIPKAKKKYLKVTIEYNGPIQAPIKKDDLVGKVKVYFKDDILDYYDLYSAEDIKKLNIFSRIINSINFLIWGDV